MPPWLSTTRSMASDGRKAALDMRMVAGVASSTPSRLDVATGRIAGIWHEYRDRSYRDPATGEPSPVPGALQIVFCDLGTPRETWNAYDELQAIEVRADLLDRLSPRIAPTYSSVARIADAGAESRPRWLATIVSARSLPHRSWIWLMF